MDDFLGKIESSFNIRFEGDELFYITTFGQLCDHITGKILLADVDDCTSQQAFYKLRDAIASAFHVEKHAISPDFALKVILPRKTRRARIKKLNTHLELKLDILRAPHWVSLSFAVLILASFVSLVFSWQIGLLGLMFSLAGLWLSNKFGNELDHQTVGQLAEKLSRENYLRSRRNPRTFNKKEVEKVLIDWFCSEFDLDKSKLSREAKFV